MLVTGAGGFVGSAVVRRLTQPGTQFWDGARIEHVVALLRPEGSLSRLETLTVEHPWSVERADVYDEREFREVLRRVRPRAVVNTALDGRVFSGETIGHAPLEASFAELEGEEGTRVVHAGSAWVLAPGLHLDEAAVVEPRSPYARHKAEEDELLPRLGARTGVDWIDLRLFNVFGRYEKASRLLPYLVAQLARGEPAAVSQGDQLRDFNDVDDIAESFALALRAPESACGALYHIGSGRATAVQEFALAVAGIVGDPELVRFGVSVTADQDLPALVADCDRARRVLGWDPRNSLHDRLQAATEWWLARLAGSNRPVQRHQEFRR